MENRETFILILFHDPHRNDDLRGRVRHVATGQEITFVSQDGLVKALQNTLREQEGKTNEPLNFST